MLIIFVDEVNFHQKVHDQLKPLRVAISMSSEIFFFFLFYNFLACLFFKKNAVLINILKMFFDVISQFCVIVLPDFSWRGRDFRNLF